ncbi:hypothetical protein D3C85_1365120 [compost metagenome]
MRHEGADLVHGFAPVLVDIDHHVGRRQRPQLVQLDVLGPADLLHRPHRRLGMDAEAGAGHHAVSQAEIEQQLGHGRHQRGDADLATGRAVGLPEGVGPHQASPLPARSALRGLRGARANSLS